MPTTFALDPVIALLAHAAFALLFASAAAHKLRDRHAFAGVLAAYRVLPAAVVDATAAGVAALEIAVTVAWLMPPLGDVAVAGTIGLVALYSTAIAVNLARGQRAIDCGCGIGGARQPISEWLLVRNVLLVAAALATRAPMSGRSLAWVDGVTLLGALVVASALWTAAHGLAAASERVKAVGGAPR
jgi:hypothetical protein